MSEHRSTGPADDPFHCIEVHVIHRTPKQRKRRWAKVNEWMQKGKFPTELPPWCVVKNNHGGGGGP